MSSTHEKEEQKAAEAVSRSSSEDLSQKGEPVAPTDDVNAALAAAAYPKGIPFFTIVLALLLNVFLVALDQTIVATAVSFGHPRQSAVADIMYRSQRSQMSSKAWRKLAGMPQHTS